MSRTVKLAMQGRHGGMGDRLGNKDERNLARGRKWRAVGDDIIGRELENHYNDSINLVNLVNLVNSLNLY